MENRTKKLACHCIPCRKSSGTPNSINLIIPDENYTEKTGKIKQFFRKGDSGEDASYNSCSNCGTIIYVKGKALGPVHVLKFGTVDDQEVLDNSKPNQEIYTKNRCAWTQPYEGAKQVKDAE